MSRWEQEQERGEIFPRPGKLTIAFPDSSVRGRMRSGDTMEYVCESLLGFNSFWPTFSIQSDSNHRCWTLILWCLQEMSFQEGPDWIYHQFSLFSLCNCVLANVFCGETFRPLRLLLSPVTIVTIVTIVRMYLSSLLVFCSPSPVPVISPCFQTLVRECCELKMFPLRANKESTRKKKHWSWKVKDWSAQSMTCDDKKDRKRVKQLSRISFWWKHESFFV